MPQIATVGLVGGLRDDGGIGTQEEPAVFRRNTIALRVLRDSGLVKRKGRSLPHHSPRHTTRRAPTLRTIGRRPRPFRRKGTTSGEERRRVGNIWVQATPGYAYMSVVSQGASAPDPERKAPSGGFGCVFLPLRGLRRGVSGIRALFRSHGPRIWGSQPVVNDAARLRQAKGRKRAVHSPQLESGRRIPRGFRLKAQSCEQRATLGKGTRARSTPTGLRQLRGKRRPQPRWGWRIPS